MKSLPCQYLLCMDMVSMHRTLIGTELFLTEGTYYYCLSQALPNRLSFSSHTHDGEVCSSLPLQAEPGTRVGHPSALLRHLKHIPRAVLNRCLDGSFYVQPGWSGNAGHTAGREVKGKSLPKSAESKERPCGFIARVWGLVAFLETGT